MKRVSMKDMMEATRLTRAGRLAEATSLLQGGTTSHVAPVGSDGHQEEIIDLLPRGGDTAFWALPPDAQSDAPAMAPMNAFTAKAREAFSALGTSDGLGGLGRFPGAHGLKPGMPAATPEIPAGARFEQHLYAEPGGQRTYKLYVPSRVQSSPALIVMLHGCTQSADDFALGTGMNALAEEQGFLVAYPEQPSSANSSKCWNWFNAADQARDGGEAALLAGITRAVIASHGIDPARVFAAGLSAGGAAAAILGARYPDLFAAVGVHSGLACGAARDMPSAFTAMQRGGGRPSKVSGAARPVRTIVFHGDGDKTVNPVNGDQVVAQFGTASLRQTTAQGEAQGRAFTRIVHSDGAGTPMVEQWVIHGAGHAWSGGSAKGSYTDPRGPDASREMVRFFLGEA
ncbi:extracellular catalytic domain type 1 short-chain-length polyhydroxyalkanoate depolymerase [Allosphingosinicella deserti]|uniref:Esterase n=1 Tax=Allosphingosinicella deserti TaxID=2116704 RepID=A0A2P7QJ09_9SPHN|nr:PHB depolymerase family esterase [Sphingomonas deserti]PSJ37943.1 esterase [Sphingomonas deserti]